MRSIVLQKMSPALSKTEFFINRNNSSSHAEESITSYRQQTLTQSNKNYVTEDN